MQSAASCASHTRANSVARGFFSPADSLRWHLSTTCRNVSTVACGTYLMKGVRHSSQNGSTTAAQPMLHVWGWPLWQLSVVSSQHSRLMEFNLCGTSASVHTSAFCVRRWRPLQSGGGSVPQSGHVGGEQTHPSGHSPFSSPGPTHFG